MNGIFPPAEKNSGSIGKDGFLRLLITQLRNQDPINPMDGADFASQLSQFNSVEQLINLNASVENLAISQHIMSESMNNALAASLAGKSISAMSDKIHVNDQSEGLIHVRLAQSASEVTIIVKRSDGTTVRTIEAGQMGKGDQQFTWDQSDEDGNRLTPGTYTVEVRASHQERPIQAYTFLKGMAERVRYTEDGVMVMIHGIAIPLSFVEEVGQGS